MKSLPRIQCPLHLSRVMGSHIDDKLIEARSISGCTGRERACVKNNARGGNTEAPRHGLEVKKKCGNYRTHEVQYLGEKHEIIFKTNVGQFKSASGEKRSDQWRHYDVQLALRESHPKSWESAYWGRGREEDVLAVRSSRHRRSMISGNGKIESRLESLQCVWVDVCQ